MKKSKEGWEPLGRLESYEGNEWIRIVEHRIGGGGNTNPNPLPFVWSTPDKETQPLSWNIASGSPPETTSFPSLSAPSIYFCARNNSNSSPFVFRKRCVSAQFDWRHETYPDTDETPIDGGHDSHIQ